MRRSPLVLTQGAGRGLLMLRENVAIPQFSFFSFFLFFIFLYPRPQAILAAAAVASVGTGRSLNFRGRRNLPFRLEDLWSQENGANPIVFLLPLLSCCLVLVWMHSWKVIGSELGSEAPAFCWKTGKGILQRTERVQENEELGKLTAYSNLWASELIFKL